MLSRTRLLNFHDFCVFLRFVGLVAELKATIEDLEHQLEASEEEASTVIAQWQETVTGLETKKAELTEALNAATESQLLTQNRLDELTNAQSHVGEGEYPRRTASTVLLLMLAHK